MVERNVASEAHSELAESLPLQALWRDGRGAGEAEARDDAKAEDQVAGQAAGQANAEADEEDTEQDTGASVSKVAGTDAAGAEANQKADDKSKGVGLGHLAGAGPREDAGDTGDGEDEREADDGEERVVAGQKTMEAEGGREGCKEVCDEVGDEGKADEGEGDEGEADEGEADEGDANDGEADEKEADDGEPDEGEANEGESDEGGQAEAGLPSPGLRRTCFVQVKVGEWEPEPAERQIVRWLDLLRRRRLRIVWAATQGMQYPEWSPGKVLLPQFEVAPILEEVDKERPAEPAELTAAGAKRSRAANYVEEVYGPRLVVEVFLALGRWHPSLRDAVVACRRADAQAAPARDSISAAARDQAAASVAEALSRLRQAERDAYNALRSEGNWMAFEEMWRISRERIGSNRIQAPRGPEVNIPVFAARHCDSCFNRWPEVQQLARPGAWAQLSDQTTLFVCSAGCGRFLCWKCRTVIGACARSPACRGELLPPFQAAIRFYPEGSERVVNWQKLAHLVDVATQLAGRGVLSDGTMLVTRGESRADRIIAEWLARRATSRRRAANNSSTEARTAASPGSGQIDALRLGLSHLPSASLETASSEAAQFVAATPPVAAKQQLPRQQLPQQQLPQQQLPQQHLPPTQQLLPQSPPKPPTSSPQVKAAPQTHPQNRLLLIQEQPPRLSEQSQSLQQQQQRQPVPQPPLPSQPPPLPLRAEGADAASPSSASPDLEELLMRLLRSQENGFLSGGREAAASWIASSASNCRALADKVGGGAVRASVPPSNQRSLAAVTRADCHGPRFHLEALAAISHGTDWVPDGGRLPDEPTLAPAETLPAELWPAATIGSPAAAAMGLGSTQMSG